MAEQNGFQSKPSIPTSFDGGRNPHTARLEASQASRPLIGSTEASRCAVKRREPHQLALEPLRAVSDDTDNAVSIDHIE